MNRMNQCLAYALTIITMSLPAWPTLAQTEAGAQDLPRIKEVRPSKTPLQFDDSVEVEFDRDVVRFSPSAPADASKFKLHLNNNPMDGLPAQLHQSSTNTIVFKLKPDDRIRSENDRQALKQAWREVLRSPGPVMPLNVGVSYQDIPLQHVNSESARKPLDFKVYERQTFGLYLGALALIIAALLYFAHRSDILRDSAPPQPPDGKRRPYSLARTQMAFWTILVLGTFGFLYLVMQDYQTLTPQSLTLLGIAVTTAVASVAIDSTKSSSVNSELDKLVPEKAKARQELDEIRDRISALKETTVPPVGRTLTPDEQKVFGEQKEALRRERINEAEKEAELKRLEQNVDEMESQLSKPVSEGFLRDIVTDKDGVTLHRFQVILWTVALGVLFIWEVRHYLQMPAFSMELLAFMGISSGAYLGFKIPEKQG